MSDTAKRARAREVEVDKNLRNFLNFINKKHVAEDKNPMAVVYGENGVEEVKTFSSGSLVLDAILGGGIPEGRVIEVWGPPASGKTSIALTTLGNVQNDPDAGEVAFFDFEFALDPRYAETLGVDMDSLIYITPQYMEEGLQMLEEFAASGLFSLIVVDSIASMVPKVEWSGELEEQNMALSARILSRALRKLVGTCARNKTTVIFINQTREKVGFVLGDPTTTPGGKAMGFYASQRVSCYRSKKIMEDGELIGYEVKLRVEKNKVGKPGGASSTILTFDKGISKAAEILDDRVGIAYGVIEKKGNTYYEKETGEKLGVGRPKSIQFLEENPETLERLSNSLAVELNRAEEERNYIVEDVAEEDIPLQEE